MRVTARDLLTFQPEKPITEAGLRNNISVGIQYLGAWLAGNGCVPVFNLMEDAATAEISRSQIWQWIRSPKGVLDDGRKVTAELVKQLLAEELPKVRAYLGEAAYKAGKYEQGSKLFEKITLYARGSSPSARNMASAARNAVSVAAISSLPCVAETKPASLPMTSTPWTRRASRIFCASAAGTAIISR